MRLEVDDISAKLRKYNAYYKFVCDKCGLSKEVKEQ
jgi:hypothetical protein